MRGDLSGAGAGGAEVAVSVCVRREVSARAKYASPQPVSLAGDARRGEDAKWENSPLWSVLMQPCESACSHYYLAISHEMGGIIHGNEQIAGGVSEDMV